ncbi:DNA-directed RNA polymerase II protein isoform 2 [Theobroma cacao]|uniref:DNA-directed RNA polymerase II protein isoform 2 n=1 Tax=Theobroma cacao TaxID=3641 RepID=A0A061FGE2_THECC|nr:DNA-directed RNA polymerase II protein isoform 2 [Theobroma cacao]
MMSKKASNCAICDNSNRASICAVCVNYRLNEYNSLLKSLKSRRDFLYSKLDEVLAAKRKADDQLNWKILQNEKLTDLKEKLRRSKEQLAQGKAKIERVSYDLKVKYGVLESARGMLEKNRVEKLEKFYPNLICTQSLGLMAITSERLHKQSVVIKQICKLFPQRRVNLDGEGRDGSCGQYDLICNVGLPRGLDPHSVPSEQLAASLGYMVQLLNLVVHNLAAPALHNSGFAFYLRGLAHGYGNEILIGMHALLLEAMNIHFLYRAKIIALLVGIIHGQIEALVILVSLQWNPREGPAWIHLEVIASIILLPLLTLLKHIRTCR